MDHGRVYPVAGTDRRSLLLRRKTPAGPAAEPAAQTGDGVLGSGPTDAGDDRPLGIALSGGGIRSAAYSLGVLQELQKRGMLRGPRRARYLSAVSGGSYIAGGMAMAALGAMEGEPAAEDVISAERPFEPGSPEENYLRNHTTYLRHGPAGILGFAWRLLLGIAINLAFIGLALHLLGRPVGWAYGWAYEGFRRGASCEGSGCHLNADVVVGEFAWVLVAAAAAVGVLAGAAAVAIRWGGNRRYETLATTSALGIGAAVLGLVFLVGVPQLLEAIRDNTMETSASMATAESTDQIGGVSALGLIGTLTAAAMAVQAWMGHSRESRAATTWVGKRLLPFLGKLRMPLLLAIAAIAGPLFLAALFVSFVNWGASSPPGAAGGGGSGELILWASLAAGLLVMWRFADLVAWSIHPFYKRRLSSAFTLRRVAPQGSDPYAEERPYETWYRLSQTQPDDFPEVLICAAANVSDYGRVPTGSHATSFVFSAESVGGPLIGEVATAKLEAAVGSRARDLTLPTAVSIAGAAVSPSMGKFTIGPLRFLLALTNLRLGVWIPNPKRVQEFKVRKKRKVYPFSPRPHYLLRELFGRNHINSPFLYVSDGGHYENLGLVELLRRHCMEVWCVDAAGDKVDKFDTMAQAMLLARSELDVEIRLDPTVMAPDPEEEADPGSVRFVRHTHAVGELHYPDGTVGRIVHIKLGVPREAPFEVRAFQSRHPSFPTDSTLSQFFTAERFDAYRILGRVAARTALADPAATEAPVHAAEAMAVIDLAPNVPSGDRS